MAKIYKHSNPHIKKLALLFSARIICGIAPLGIIIVFIFNLGDSDVMAEIWLAIALGIILALFMLVSNRYNILLSGYRGERQLLKIARKIKGKEICFFNIPLTHGKRQTEIDMLILHKGGLLIIEVKNHSGTISGSDNNANWIQEKIYRKNGQIKTESKTINNPLRQIKRQKEILNSILNDKGLDVQIDSGLFFSNPAVHLNIRPVKSVFITNQEKDVVDFIKNRKSKTVLNSKDFNQIVELFTPR